MWIRAIETDKERVSSSPAYFQLPGRHEVGTLSDPLEDPLQLGVDEGVVWTEKKMEMFENDGEKKKLPRDPGTVRRVSRPCCCCRMHLEC